MAHISAPQEQENLKKWKGPRVIIFEGPGYTNKREHIVSLRSRIKTSGLPVVSINTIKIQNSHDVCSSEFHQKDPFERAEMVVKHLFDAEQRVKALLQSNIVILNRWTPSFRFIQLDGIQSRYPLMKGSELHARYMRLFECYQRLQPAFWIKHQPWMFVHTQTPRQFQALKAKRFDKNSHKVFDMLTETEQLAIVEKYANLFDLSVTNVAVDRTHFRLHQVAQRSTEEDTMADFVKKTNQLLRDHVGHQP